MPGMTTTEFKVPPMADGLKNNRDVMLEGFTVKYCKADMDDVAETQILQQIETRGLNGIDVVILNRDKFTFMDKYFIVLQYMERSPQ